MLQHRLRQRGKGPLIIQCKRKCIKVAAGIFLNPATQHVDPSGCASGDRQACEALAHDQRQCCGDRHFVCGLCAADGVSAQFKLKRMAKVCCDPRHVARSQRLDPSVFHGVKGRTSDDFGRSQGGMACSIMMFQLQCKAVGKSPCFGHLIGGEQPARHWNLEIFASLAWRIGGEGQFDFRLMRKCAGCARQNLLKLLKGGFMRH